MKRPHKKIIASLIGVLGVGYCAYRSLGPGSLNTPQEMFQHVIRNPIPPSVKNLQGIGDTWQGYSLYLRFTASDADIDSLVAGGYRPVAWEKIAFRFALPTGYDRFKPSWDPDAIATKECYEADGMLNSWGNGFHYLAIDRRTGTVYFYGLAG